nr:LysR family transcriptional regulator [Klebsiella quasipneumoniae]
MYPVRNQSVRDDLNAIPVFVTVVESGNFASAATILHVTRSAVGKTIARLEARLGVALFQRTTRRQLLTEEGEQFYHQCREALGRIREAEEALQRGKGEVQGRLRISLPVLFGQRCVAPLLFRLSQRYPLLKLELHYSDRQVNLLEEGFDLAVRIGSLADTGSLRARALGEHGMVLCAAAEYLRRQPAPQTIAGLSEHRTLGYLHNGQLQKWQLYDPQQGEVRFTPEAWLVQDDFAAIAAAAQQGMGIAWLPDWLVAQALADGTLQQVLAPSGRVRFAIHAVWPEGPWLPQKTRVAIDALREGLRLAKSTPPSG